MNCAPPRTASQFGEKRVNRIGVQYSRTAVFPLLVTSWLSQHKAPGGKERRRTDNKTRTIQAGRSKLLLYAPLGVGAINDARMFFQQTSPRCVYNTNSQTDDNEHQRPYSDTHNLGRIYIKNDDGQHQKGEMLHDVRQNSVDELASTSVSVSATQLVCRMAVLPSLYDKHVALRH